MVNIFAFKEKNVIFWSCFIGYWIYYVNRKSAIYSISIILNDGTSELTTEHFGMVASIQMMFYIAGKMLTGIVVDQMSGKLIFSVGMLVVGVANFCYGLCVSPIHFYIIAAVNGFFQACGWNVIAVLLKRWFDKTEFGTIWSLASTSMNVSNSLSPFLVMKLSRTYQWRTSFFLIGTLTCALSIIFYCILKDRPNTEFNNTSRVHSPAGDKVLVKEEKEDEVKRIEKTRPLTFFDLFTSPVLWIISTCYLLCCFVKNGTEDWMQLYLISDRNFSDNAANFNLMAFQTGGLVSNIISGVLSDFLVKKLQSKMVATPRLLVVLFCTVTVSFWFYILHFNRYFNSMVAVTISCFFLGLCCYGPYNLFGIIIMENAPMELSGTAHALATTFSSVGLVLAGYPVVYLSSNYGWSSAFWALIMVSMMTSILVLFTTQMDSRIVKRKQE